jgi:hypothetical protein
VKSRLPLVIAGGAVLAFACSAPSAAVPRVADGSFEIGAREWKATGTAPAGCELPYRSIGTRADSATAAYLGDNRSAPSPGCDPAWIVRIFECGNHEPPNGCCTVTFHASLWLVAGERAAVVLTSGGDVAAYEIPGERGGKSGRYAASIAASGRVTLVFAVWNSPGSSVGTRSLLRVDDVRLFQTPNDITSSLLTPLHLDAVPFDWRSVEGHPMRADAGLTDCNENKLPDNYEISQGMTADRDGDGRPDDCQQQGRRVDWVLLALGGLVLTATFLRVIRKSRARHV